MCEKIATIINYCSNDYPFLKEAIYQANKFSKKVIVVASDHFFDGQKEDLNQLENSFSEFDFATFIIYPFIPEKIPRRILKKVRENVLFHSVSRMVGSSFLGKDIDHVLFLDVDEIVDGDRFKAWLGEKHYLGYDVLRPANYWYFKSPSSQAKKWEDSAVFIKRKKIKRKALLDSTERDAIFDTVKGNKKRNVLGLDNLPMIHHYSWVKTKKQMLTKVNSWGHKDDKDWRDLVEKEFEKTGMGKDFIHGYDLIKVESFVEIDINGIEDKRTKMSKKNQIKEPNIIHLSEVALLKMIKKRSIKDYIHCYFEKFKIFEKKYLNKRLD